MTVVSRNLYRASWLAPVARAACWPLSLLLLVLGLVLRLLGFFRAGFAHGSDPLQGAPAARRHLRAYVGQALRYGAFRGNEFPPLTGPVRRAGESPGPWHAARRRLVKSHVAMLSTIVFVGFVYAGVAAQAGWIASDWKEKRDAAEYKAPGEIEGAPLGTDFIGHSVGSMALRGVATALWIGVFAALLSSLVGMLLGALAGWFGGWLDDLIVWLYTTLDSIPYLLLLMAFSYVFTKNATVREWYDERWLRTHLGVTLGLFSIIVVVGLTSWVGVCRVVRAEYIKQREREYVAAARALGYSTGRIMFRHVMPNVFHLVLVSYSLLFVSAIKFEVILSFLGLGMEPGEPSWGNMISRGAGELLRHETVWWPIVTAGVLLFLLILSVNLLADALRDALDPRS